jgi:hypothetical protein
MEVLLLREERFGVTSCPMLKCGGRVPMRATTFETDKDLMVEGKALPAGKIWFLHDSGEKEWVIIFNKVPDQWGAFKYDDKQDALRVKVNPVKSEKMNERLLYTVNDKEFPCYGKTWKCRYPSPVNNNVCRQENFYCRGVIFYASTIKIFKIPCHLPKVHI